MTTQEISRIKTHLNNLDDEFSCGLTEDMRSQTTVEPDSLQVAVKESVLRFNILPVTSAYRPPSSVRLIVLEFSGEEHCNQDLEDTSLNHDHSDDPKNCVRGVPKF
jgi:hypothetical protein